MSYSSTIPLVRAAVFEAVITTARQIGVPIEKRMESVGLPPQKLESADLLPELPVWHFVQSVSKSEGIKNFGLIAAESTPHNDISTLAPLIAGCSNLYELLKQFCVVAPLQSSIANYALEKRGDTIWLIQNGIRLLAEDIQVQLFEVLGIIQLVQLATGTTWRPDEIHFTFRQRAEVESAAQLKPSKMFFSQAYPAIAFPRQLLALPLPRLRPQTHYNTVIGTNHLSMPESFPEGLRSAITPYLGTQKLNKTLLSEIVGLSPRTLQRRLAEQHTSYSRVLDQARLLKALDMLKETDATCLDISLMLGYENASTLTRSFRRWMGVSPREYRNIQTTT